MFITLDKLLCALNYRNHMCIDQKKTRIIQSDITERKLDTEMHPVHYNWFLDSVFRFFVYHFCGGNSSGVTPLGLIKVRN